MRGSHPLFSSEVALVKVFLPLVELTETKINEYFDGQWVTMKRP